MKTVSFKIFICTVLLSCVPIANCFAAAAGKFNFVIGDVRVVNTSGERKAVRGGEVEADETIVSGKDGMAQLHLSDGAFIALRADTELRIDKYQYDSQKPASNDTVLFLIKGTMRAFTGAIAIFNKDKFKMKTMTATIGVRGSGNVLNFSPLENMTLNHTIEGSHSVTTFDARGQTHTLVTMPGQTVQINSAGAMKFVPTPSFIIEAVTAARKTEPNQSQKSDKPNQIAQLDDSKNQQKNEAHSPQPDKGNTQQPSSQGGMPVASSGTGKSVLFATGAETTGSNMYGETATKGTHGEATKGSSMLSGMSSTLALGGNDDPVTTGMSSSKSTSFGTSPMNSTLISGGSQKTTAVASSDIATGELGAYGASSTRGILSTAPGTYNASNGDQTKTTSTTYVTSQTYSATAVSSDNATHVTATYALPQTFATSVSYTESTTRIPAVTPTVVSTYTAPTTSLLPTASTAPVAYNCVSNSECAATLFAYQGAACSGAGSVSGPLYCNGSTWITPVVGGACIGGATVSGLACNGTSWIAITITPGFSPSPTSGYMYDAFGSQVLIPANGYRHVSYTYATSANTTAMEISMDRQIVTPGSWSSSFSAPSTTGTATSSTNTSTFTVGDVQLDFGYDSVTGMSWGRWQGNWDAAGSNSFTATATSNLHWFATSTQSQAVTLPMTGSWNYTLVGNTAPTDNAGTTGTLNSASFSANFTAQTVNVGVNVSMPSSPANASAVTLNASAVGVPIMSGGNFKTSTPTVTCSGACGATSGVIAGQFSAPSGAGVGVGYGLNNGRQTINGVAVFRH